MPTLLSLVPTKYGRYYEPFLGGAALFFALRPAKARLADTNRDLMNAYGVIKRSPAALSDQLRAMAQSEDDFYRVRAASPRTSIARAARTIYLVTLAFNGIYRVNHAGQFNVPYGGRTYPALGLLDTLEACSAALQTAELETGSFRRTTRDASAGDLVYFDPPYTSSHSNNGFVKYNARIFQPEHQVRLAELAHELVGRGCSVIVSNAYHHSIKELYGGFDVLEVDRTSVIAAAAKHRQPVKEFIFSSVASGS